MTAPDAPSGRAFWCGLAIGGGIVAYGTAGLLATNPFSSVIAIGTWVISADLIHDLLLAPVVVLVSLLLTRAVPLPWRAPLRSALAASAILGLVAYPALRGFGHDTAPDNPTVQPLDYTTALLTVLAVVWTLALLWTLAIALRRRGDPQSTRNYREPMQSNVW